MGVLCGRAAGGGGPPPCLVAVPAPCRRGLPPSKRAPPLAPARWVGPPPFPKSRGGGRCTQAAAAVAFARFLRYCPLRPAVYLQRATRHGVESRQVAGRPRPQMRHVAGRPRQDAAGRQPLACPRAREHAWAFRAGRALPFRSSARPARKWRARLLVNACHLRAIRGRKTCRGAPPAEWWTPPGAHPTAATAACPKGLRRAIRVQRASERLHGRPQYRKCDPKRIARAGWPQAANRPNTESAIGPKRPIARPRVMRRACGAIRRASRPGPRLSRQPQPAARRTPRGVRGPPAECRLRG